MTTEIARTNQVHFGPDLTFNNGEPPHLGFYTLITCLYLLDRPAYQLVLQRYAHRPGLFKKSRPEAHAPWLAFNRVVVQLVHEFVGSFDALLGLRISEETQTHLYADFRQKAEAIAAFTVLEKLCGHPSAKLRRVKRLLGSAERVENLLQWVDGNAPEAFKDGLKGEFAYQAACLRDAHDELWDDVIAKNWAGIDTGSVANIHDELCGVVSFIFTENHGMQRCIGSGLNPARRMQEELSLLATFLVGLYNAYPYAQVQAAIAEAAQMVNTDRLKGLARMEKSLGVDTLPPEPPPPQRKPRPDWLSVVK